MKKIFFMILVLSVCYTQVLDSAHNIFAEKYESTLVDTCSTIVNFSQIEIKPDTAKKIKKIENALRMYQINSLLVSSESREMWFSYKLVPLKSEKMRFSTNDHNAVMSYSDIQKFRKSLSDTFLLASRYLKSKVKINNSFENNGKYQTTVSLFGKTRRYYGRKKNRKEAKEHIFGEIVQLFSSFFDHLKLKVSHFFYTFSDLVSPFIIKVNTVFEKLPNKIYLVIYPFILTPRDHLKKVSLSKKAGRGPPKHLYITRLLYIVGFSKKEIIVGTKKKPGTVRLYLSHEYTKQYNSESINIPIPCATQKCSVCGEKNCGYNIIEQFIKNALHERCEKAIANFVKQSIKSGCTPRELICLLLVQVFNISTKEVAIYLKTDQGAVTTAIYRVNKKLSIKPIKRKLQ